jgi:hypothetical protein
MTTAILLRATLLSQILQINLIFSAEPQQYTSGAAMAEDTQAFAVTDV